MTLQKTLSAFMVVALSVVGCVHLYGQQSPSVLEFPEDDLGADPAVAADGTLGEIEDVEGESGGGIREIFDFLAEKGSKALNFGEGEDPGDAVDESEGKAIELKQLSNLNISNAPLPMKTQLAPRGTRAPTGSVPSGDPLSESDSPANSTAH